MKESYKFWLGLLNSQLFWFFIQQTGYILRGGYFTFKTNYILPFPVPAEINKDAVKRIENLVTEILKAKQKSTHANTVEQERAIDQIVYSVYGISEREIEVVEESLPARIHAE